jgi:molybdate transport system regulatory protein
MLARRESEKASKDKSDQTPGRQTPIANSGLRRQRPQARLRRSKDRGPKLSKQVGQGAMEKNVKTKVWLDLGGGVAFCHGKADLLLAIEELGSINRAAQKVNMSYKRAWKYIRDLERCLGAKILVTTVGGVNGGGSRLTEVARNLLREYEETKEQVNRTLTQNVRLFSRSF